MIWMERAVRGLECVRFDEVQNWLYTSASVLAYVKFSMKSNVAHDKPHDQVDRVLDNWTGRTILIIFKPRQALLRGGQKLQ